MIIIMIIVPILIMKVIIIIIVIIKILFFLNINYSKNLHTAIIWLKKYFFRKYKSLFACLHNNGLFVCIS